MKKLIGLLAVVFLVGYSGCKTDGNVNPSTKSATTSIVVVGMENSRFAGECPGAGYDADRMAKILAQFSTNVVLLRDGAATKSAVVNALTKAIETAGDGLVIFFYSGHGGSDPFHDTGTEEEDGKDEYYCFYDTYMRDNEMWQMIQKCEGRIMLINDCCHSKTLYRSPKITLKATMPLAYAANARAAKSMLCWSGCPDNTYSYGSSTGGQFTNALLRHFGENKTYEALWNEIKNDRTLRQYEDPQKTVIGNGFDGKLIFR